MGYLRARFLGGLFLVETKPFFVCRFEFAFAIFGAGALCSLRVFTVSLIEPLEIATSCRLSA